MATTTSTVNTVRGGSSACAHRAMYASCSGKGRPSCRRCVRRSMRTIVNLSCAACRCTCRSKFLRWRPNMLPSENVLIWVRDCSCRTGWGEPLHALLVPVRNPEVMVHLTHKRAPLCRRPPSPSKVSLSMIVTRAVLCFNFVHPSSRSSLLHNKPVENAQLQQYSSNSFQMLVLCTRNELIEKKKTRFKNVETYKHYTISET